MGKADGKGVYTWKDGSSYEGDWKSGIKEGNGVFTNIMGDKIIGEFIKDKIYGKVIISHKNGDLYEGDCL